MTAPLSPQLQALRDQFLRLIEAAANEAAAIQDSRDQQHAAELHRLRSEGAVGAAYRQGQADERARALTLLDAQADRLLKARHNQETISLMALRHAIADDQEGQ